VANAADLKPYLGFQGTDACSRIGLRMPGAPTLTEDACAEAIIAFARGKDVFDEDADTVTDENRINVLGDIFHSSPVVVEPPIDQFICALGLHAQCTATLFGYAYPNPVASPTPTELATVGGRQLDAYEKYFRDNQTRQKLVLVGANDGMLHAFNGGTAVSTTEACEVAGRGGCDPALPFRGVRYGSGTGDEVWAFVPPDQLGRLWHMMVNGHQFSMDGDIMVRDVWVDGIGTSNVPGRKESFEYRTVAVVSEREGGTRFLGFDVSTPNDPQLKWVYPHPCTMDAQQFGQTWGQFAPRPPPIGPFLLESNATSAVTRYGTGTEERWAVFLNGGTDAFQTRGRTVALVDVWSGEPLFKAGYDPSASGDRINEREMKYGFAATAALVDFGVDSTYQPDGFFDTAILGDLGGNLWTFRLNRPGHRIGTGLVDNWSFGRSFDPTKATPNAVRPRQPIYTVAATTVQVENGYLRAFVGNGDRSRVRSTAGGDCRPDSPKSCLDAGCTVAATLTQVNGPRQLVSTYGGSSLAFTTPSVTPSTTSAHACDAHGATLSLAVTSCPTSSLNHSVAPSSQCTTSGTYACTEAPLPTPVPGGSRGSASDAAGESQFVGVAVLSGDVGSPARARRLNAPGDAETYDQGRLAVSDLADVTATTATRSSVSGTTASRGSAGWRLGYGTVDEKTVTSAALLGGCVIWSSLLPFGGSGGCASAGAVGAPFYQADFVTGAPNCAQAFLQSDSTYVRRMSRNVISPPPEPAAVVAIGAGSGSMRLSALEIQPGAEQVTQISVNTNTEMLQLLYSIPLNTSQHECRHADGTKCP
jgi:type IV pilus assembly protein PilY1